MSEEWEASQVLNLQVSYCPREKNMVKPFGRASEDWEGAGWKFVQLFAVLMLLCDYDTRNQVESMIMFPYLEKRLDELEISAGEKVMLGL